MTQRTRRSMAGSVLVVLAIVIGAVVATALQADGRERSQADTNDGGAWLLKRDVGAVGHVNRAVGEVTAALSIAEPGADYDVDQARDVIAVHDRSSGILSMVDDRVQRVLNKIEVPGEIDIHAVDGGVLAIRPDSLAVWRLDLARLSEMTSLEEDDPMVTGDGGAVAAVRPDGTAAIVDQAADRVVFLAPDGTRSASPPLGLTDAATGVTLVGDTAVLTDADGDLFSATPDAAAPIPAESAGPIVLQQPSSAARQIVAVSGDGEAVAIDLVDGTGTPIATLGGDAPVAPIVHGGCTFAVVTEPARYTQVCGTEVVQSVALDGGGSELRLRLVNGWVWVNDLDTGAAWVTSPEQLLDRIEDWGAILSDDSDVDENSTENEGGEEETRVNPDAEDVELREADELDEDGVNDPPIARDDETMTREERPIEIDVLANDEDPDGDVILVTNLSAGGGDAQVWVNDAHDAVQVTPAAGFSGTVTFDYTISDGRGLSDAATVVVEVTPLDGSNNRPPVAETDVAETRRGTPTTLNVLDNDTDPDGDTLVLESVALGDQRGGEGSIVSDPSGHLVFTPDAAGTAERIELSYVVSDDFGATADGKVIVNVRLDDSNNEPDARNDAAVAVVGKPVTFNLLDNDTDPDDDPLFIAQLPTLVQPADRTIADLRLTLSPDGELFFLPENAGTFIFTYSVTDGQETDVAQIRVDVSRVTENKPPVAVRDDVVIPAGGSRMVYVLENDGDPDGDIVGLVNHTPVDGLQIEEVDGIGYRVTVDPDAPTRLSFRYEISDGIADPVSTYVVVSVIDTEVIDQPPVARADVIELRAGGAVQVPVLANDYDPEGGSLEVTSVTEQTGVVAAPGLAGQYVDLSVTPDVTASFDLGYTVVDRAGNRSSAIVRVRIVPPGEPNRAPVARYDVARTRAGVPISIPVLRNDTDPDGDAIDVENLETQPLGGSAFVETDGTITYRPSGEFAGTDRFTYALVDANGERAVGEVLVGVMPASTVNRPPEARDDDFEVVAGAAPLALDALDNDYDADGDRLAITQAGGVSRGEIAVADDGGAVVFDPPDTTGTTDGSPVEIAVTYSIDDGRGGTDTGTIVITLISAADPIPPIAVNDQGGPATPGERVVIAVLANDLDADGDVRQLQVSSADPTVRVDGRRVSIVAGEASSRHRYTVTDPSGLTDSGDIAVLVVENRAPTVQPLVAETPADQPITLELGPQARDPDGDDLFFTCCNSARGGRAEPLQARAGALNVRFVPNTTFSGVATFSYGVDDQQGHKVGGSVSITVLPPRNRPPAAADRTIDVAAGTTGTVDLTALATDPDPDEELTFTVGEVSNGAVALERAGTTVRVTADIASAGQRDSFGYTVTDALGESARGTVTINVLPPIQPDPVARADGPVSTNQGEPVMVAVLDNDVDPIGQGLQVIGVGVTQGGTASVQGAQILFAPSSAFFGPTAFSYTIRDAAGREASSQVSVDVVGRPGLPGTPSATAGNAQATITWRAPSPNGAPIDDYAIRIGGGGDGQSIGNTTSHTWDALTNGEAVQFSVRAHNAAGWGDWSALSAPVTPDIEPGRPATPAVRFQDGALLVTWSPPANSGSAIRNYNLQIGGGANEVRDVGNTTSYTWTGLANGTEYTFVVQAVNTKGPGEFSSPSASEHPLRAPDAPNAPVAQRGNRFLDISWQPPGNGGDQIVEFQAQMRSSGATNSSTSASIRWANLPNGQEQQFRVRARNRGGWGGWSGYSAPVKPCTVPDVPAPPAAARGDTSATITWTPPNDQGCALSGYEIRSSQGQSVGAGAGTTSVVFSGLANGTEYTFQVEAINEEGRSGWSPSSNPVIPAGPPFKTAITQASPQVGAVDLAWNAANGNGRPIAHYELSINGGGPIGVGGGTAYRASGLNEGTTYTFQIRGVNEIGVGEWSDPVSATTPGRPNQVGGLSVSAGNGRLDASWSEPGNNGSGITGYNVERSPGGTQSTGSRGYTWSDVSNGQQYGVRVQACNAVGCGAWSGWEYATPQSPLSVSWSKGRNAQGQPGCSSVHCRWIDVSASGLTPGRTYSVQCWATTFGRVGGPNSATANGSGSLSRGDVCYFGYPDETFWVVLEPGTHHSDHRRFG